MCHQRNLNAYLDDSTIDGYLNGEKHIDGIKDACFRNNVMMGCKEKDSSTIDLLAWAPRGDVFKTTDEVGCGKSGPAQVWFHAMFYPRFLFLVEYHHTFALQPNQCLTSGLDGARHSSGVFLHFFQKNKQRNCPIKGFSRERGRLGSRM